MTQLPTGTITFLFTDIEGSTRLLTDLESQFKPVLERHQELIRAAVASHAGVEIATEGDSFFCVFNTAPDGLAAAVDIQRRLAHEEWPGGRNVRVRIGVHTGTAALGGDNYVGIDVHRAARISESGHGGQVLVSAATRLLGAAGLSDGVTFQDLGEVHLRDLEQPEHLYQLVIDGIESSFPPLRKLQVGPTNIPAAASSFIGRGREQVEVEKLLDDSRLVTITGVAGAGKSRLALEVAAKARQAYADGVWFVELAPVRNDDVVAQAVAHAIGLQESPGRVAEDVLADYLRAGKRLLVLDNCEFVIEGVRRLAARLIAETTDLTILATSRQVLGTGGEIRYQCPPLDMPPSSAASSTDLAGFDATALFEVRAQEADPSFVVTDDIAGVVATICRRLDGMPLAIELAAALVRILTPNEILHRLDDRFDLLRGGPRSAPEHQQTLLAALESTFDLLDDAEQEFAMRLGVFVGGVDATAAEAVTAGGSISRVDVLDALSALVDRSLISSVQGSTGMRLAILESVREFLLAKLEESGQLRVRQLAHARYFTGLIESASRELRGPEQDTWAARLDADIGNVRAAIAFTAATGDEGALDLVNRLFLYWRRRGDWSDGLRWTRVALENTSERDSAIRARMLSTAGFFASDLGDGVRGIADLEDGLAMARRTGDVHAQGYCASFLGAELSRRDTDLDRGLELLSEARQIYADLHEPYGEAWVNRYLALSHQERGELDESIRLQTFALDAFREARDTWNIRFSLTLLAEAKYTIGDLAGARDLYDESLRGSADVQYKVVMAQAHKGLGKVSLAEGKLDEASDHLREAMHQLMEIGDAVGQAETGGHLGMVHLGRGHPADAAEQLLQSLRVFAELQDRGGVAWSLERLAAVDLDVGSGDRAALLLGAADRIRERSGSIRPPIDQPAFDRLVAKVQDQIGPEAYAKAAQSGAGLTFTEAIALGDG
jgi:predicted ATPase/class 3 adenylate cyclase